MKKNFILKSILLFFILLAITSTANSTAISITDTGTTNSNTIGVPAGLIGGTLVGDYSDDSVLYVWDEVQNFSLTANLNVDRVADSSASYVGGNSSSGYFIKSGTIVSSHYVQWDPDGYGFVDATLNFDSNIFAFITSDANLFASDTQLGHPNINYGNFTYRGLESGDTTFFNGGSVDIAWAASSPGDWTRLITAFSPGGDTPVPEPATMLLFGLGLLGLAGVNRRKK